MKQLKYFLMGGALFLLFLIIAQCRKKESDHLEYSWSITPGSLSVAPVDWEAVSGLVPLGNLNPPGHTFPTKHTYIYFMSAIGTTIDVKAPGNLHIFQISRFRNETSGVEDYRIEMGDPAGNALFLAHLSSIQPGLLGKVNGFSNAICETYTTGGSTIEYCRKPVAMDVNTGDVIATIVPTVSVPNIDMGATVNGAYICPLNFFAADAKASMEAKLGTASGSYRRSALPLCGEHDYNIIGTLQGNWYRQGAPREPEDAHIAFVKENFRPERLKISIGSGVPGIASGVYGIGIDGVNDGGVTAGPTGRTFASVTADGQTYCYPPFNNSGSRVLNTSFIVKLENSNTLSFEKRDCDCSCTPYNFTSAKITYSR